jgi:hypothetical protein
MCVGAAKFEGSTENGDCFIAVSVKTRFNVALNMTIKLRGADANNLHVKFRHSTIVTPRICLLYNPT